MKFLFVANQTLPPLAWCLNLVRSATTAEVMHGVGVDCKAEFFFEGCWSGAQDTDGVLNASVCAASGVAIRGKSLIAFCPTNTLARLHVIKHQNQLWISNSMAFAVAASNKAIRPDYHFYQEDLSSIIHGLAKAVGTGPLQDGAFLKLFYHCNINID